jgi:hypothetical protein
MRKIEENEESGSAIVEFLTVALPLFLPALIFFMAMSNTAKREIETIMIARQALHAFLEADSDSQGYSRVNLLIREYKNLGGALYEELDYEISCSKTPCLTAEGIVEILIENGGKNEAIARGYADKWQ